MAWFKTGEGDDLSGDWPADLVASALSRMLAAAPSPPSLAALLRIWQDALNAEPRALLAEAAAAAYRLSAQVGSIKAAAGESRTVPAAAEPSPIELRTIALEALRGVAEAWSDAADRLPRASELARCLSSNLGNPAEDGRLADGPIVIECLCLEPAAS